MQELWKWIKNRNGGKEQGSLMFEPAELKEEEGALRNPARGWYRIYTFQADRKPDTEELRWCLDRDETIALVLIDIGAFRSRELTAEALENIRTILDFFDRNGRDLILRIVYDRTGKGMEMEPFRFDRVLSHLEQLGPLLSQLGKRILVWQGMLVGSWGEMHSSRYLSAEHLTQMEAVLNRFLDASTFLAVRKPVFLRCMHPEMETDAKTWGRLTLFDDGIFGSPSHLGTFGTVPRAEAGWNQPWAAADELAFENRLCLSAPNGGEAVYGPGMEQPQSADDVLACLKQMHVTYLNCRHDLRLLDQWKNWTIPENGTCFAALGEEEVTDEKTCSFYDYIGNHLGYRFCIRSVSLTFERNRQCTLSMEVENTGFGNFCQEAEAYLAVQTAQGEWMERPLEWDIRSWNSGERCQCTASIDCAEGDAALYIGMRRRWDQRQIRFANQSDENGLVLLGHIRRIPE
ncbi:MAG: DUF4832 domain-containing protein [Lachnospiraceae bacterium]|nr:DUF4832 domain-containing protein [Lachnospiraceae bacterium]